MAVWFNILVCHCAALYYFVQSRACANHELRSLFAVFTKLAGLITSSNTTVRAVHSYNGCFVIYPGFYEKKTTKKLKAAFIRQMKILQNRIIIIFLLLEKRRKKKLEKRNIGQVIQPWNENISQERQLRVHICINQVHYSKSIAFIIFVHDIIL